MQKNVASQKIQLFAFDATTNVPKTGDATNITAYVSKDHGAVTVLGDTTAAEMDATNSPGVYVFDLTAGETNADELTFSAKSTTANIKIVPRFISTSPAQFTSPWISGGGASVIVGDKTGFSLAAGGLTGTAYVPPTTALAESYSALHAAPTEAQLLFEIRGLLQEKAVASTTLTVKKVDGSTTAMTFTLDSATAPTSITRAT